MFEDSSLILELYKKIEVHHCPYCNSKRFYRHGKYRYTIRYKCVDCGKTFIPSTGTSIHYIHKKEQFVEYGIVMREEGLLPLKQLSQRFKINVLTAFDWRHKQLISVLQRSPFFKGDVYFSLEKYYFSEKGRRGLFYGRRRGGEKIKEEDEYHTKVFLFRNQGLDHILLLNAGEIRTYYFEKAIENKSLKCFTLYSDSNPSYKLLNNESFRLRVKYKQVRNAEDLTHIEKINYIKTSLLQIKENINIILRGVSTKYLQLYLNYYLHRNKLGLDPLSKGSLNRKYVWSIYSKMEDIYHFFKYRFTSLAILEETKRKWKTADNYFLKQSYSPVFIDYE